MAQVVYDGSGMPQSVVLDYQEFADLTRRAEQFEQVNGKLDGIFAALLAAARSNDGLHRIPAAELSEASVQSVAPANTGDDDAEPSSIRTFAGARGYYMGHKRFRVLKGSFANSSTTPSFDGKNHLVNLRTSLMRDGVLASDPATGRLVFTRDWEFDSSSAAA